MFFFLSGKGEKDLGDQHMAAAPQGVQVSACRKRAVASEPADQGRSFPNREGHRRRGIEIWQSERFSKHILIYSSRCFMLLSMETMPSNY